MKKFLFDLQLFSDGGAAGTAGAGVTGEASAEGTAGTVANAKGVAAAPKKTNSLSQTRYGRQNEAEADVKEKSSDASIDTDTEEMTEEKAERKSFDELLSDKEYGDEFEKRSKARADEAVKRRFRENDEKERKYDSLRRYFSDKYGVDFNDLNAIAEKADEERRAEYKRKDMEEGRREGESEKNANNAYDARNLRAQLEDVQEKLQNERDNARIDKELKEAKKLYPNLDFKTEAKDPGFARLIRSGVDVRTAYEVVHRDEILGGAMEAAAKTASEKVANSIASGMNRPSESGISNGSAARVVTDPKSLTKEDRKEIKRRVRNGEKIVW